MNFTYSALPCVDGFYGSKVIVFSNSFILNIIKFLFNNVYSKEVYGIFSNADMNLDLI